MEGQAIKVENLSKTFKLPHEKSSSIKSSVVNFYRRNKGYELQRALNNVSFGVKQGEFFGIVGRNGSGKSTLLKLIAGIYSPTKGQIHVRGMLTPFIELGVGFNPELTGRENVFLNGALLGFNRKEMNAMYDEIVEFAELKKFMDQKLKNYSSGMQVRLAFSIAIQAKGGILVLDEVLAVGDAAFQQKCINYFESLKQQRQTVILVTHDMETVRRFCDRAMLLENGVVKSIGSPDEIAQQYTLDNMNQEAAGGKSKELSSSVAHLDIKTEAPLALGNSDDLTFKVEYKLNESIPVHLGIALLYQGTSVMEHNTKGFDLPHTPNVKHFLKYKLPLKNFNPGRYEISVAIFAKQDFRLIGFNTGSCSIIVNGRKKGGIVSFTGQWLEK